MIKKSICWWGGISTSIQVFFLGVSLTMSTPSAFAGPHSVIVMAAGQGTRMYKHLPKELQEIQAKKPKVLYEVNGQTMISHILNQIHLALKDEKNVPVAVVVGHSGDLVKKSVQADPIFSQMKIDFVEQIPDSTGKLKGTGDAARAAMNSAWGDARVKEDSEILVIAGDYATVPSELLSQLLTPLPQDCPIRLLTGIFQNPGAYGRILRSKEDHRVLGIREYKDATPEERDIKEVNVSTYVFQAKFLQDSLRLITDKNAQNEFYLTDVIGIGAADPKNHLEGFKHENPDNLKGVNSPEELKEAEEIIARRKKPQLVRSESSDRLVNQASILRKGPFYASEFQIQFTENSFNPGEKKERLDQIWNEIETKTKAAGREVWDNLYYRLENRKELSEGAKTLHLSTIPYSTVRSLIEIAKAEAPQEKDFPLQVNTGGLIRTSDGYYVFGLKGLADGKKSMEMVGGGLQPKELEVRVGADLGRNMTKEMSEEVNIGEEYLADQKILGFIFAENKGIIIAFKNQLNIPIEKVQQLFPLRKDKELVGIHAVPDSEVASFLAGQQKDALRTLGKLNQ